MARTKAQLTDNFRESDLLTLASLLGVVPFEAFCHAMTRCGLATQRYRKLPLELMAYYVICLSLYSSISLQEVLHCILEGFEWLKIKMKVKNGSAQCAVMFMTAMFRLKNCRKTGSAHCAVSAKICSNCNKVFV